MLSDKELLEFILEQCKKLSVTAYEIGQNTSVSQMGAHNILSGVSKNPKRKTLLAIVEYLESKVVGTKTEMVTEPESGRYTNPLKRRIAITDVFSDIGTELILSYKNQISLHEENAILYKKNAVFMEEKIFELEIKRG